MTGVQTCALPIFFDYTFSTRMDSGIGFGLGIVKRIIEKDHGGSIIVESKWGEWTNFKIRMARNNQRFTQHFISNVLREDH